MSYRLAIVLVGLAMASHGAETAGWLHKLERHVPFTSWKGHVSDAAIAASQKIYQSTLAELLGIGPGKQPARYIPVLSRYIEEFNRIDKEHAFIETVEREEICEELGKIMDILKLPGIDDCDDLPAVRDW